MTAVKRSARSSSGDRSRAIALLRGVNVGGRGMLRMADLKSMLEQMGFVDPQTLLQSGNVVFGFASGKARAARVCEERIQAELLARFTLESDVFVRSADEWRDLVSANPFAGEAESDPARLVAVVLRDAPAPAAVKALQASIKGPEVVRSVKRQLYIVFPDGQGRSKLTHTLIERTLGTRGTARNWNTVLKLAALAGA